MDDAINAPEQWRPVHGYVGHYEVSDQGRVRSLTRIAGLVRPRRVKGRILRPGRLYDGRAVVNLSVNSETQMHRVSVLVLEAFVQPRPSGLVVCHENGDASDDQIENLRWDTQGENMRDKRRHGTDHELNRTDCRFGHEKAGENLLLVQAKNSRECWACHLASGHIRRCDPGFKELADRYYAQILAGHRAHGRCHRGHEVRGSNAFQAADGVDRCRSCKYARTARTDHRKRNGVVWSEEKMQAEADRRYALLSPATE